MKKEERQLQELRRLKKQIYDLEMRYDRFGREEYLREVGALQARVKAMPEAVRVAAERADTLEALPGAMEEYLMTRASRFLEDPSDLAQTILHLAEQRDVPKSAPAVQRLLALLGTLETLQIGAEEVQIAALLAQELRHVRALKPRYLTQLRRLVSTYLDDRQRLLMERWPKGWETDAAGRLPEVDEPEDLLWASREWQDRIAAYRARFADFDVLTAAPAQRVEIGRRRIMSQISLLQRLGVEDTAIDDQLFQAQTEWDARQGKKKKP